MSKFVPLIEGAALIGTGLFLEFVTFGVSTPLTVALISAGAGMVLTGIGTLLSQGPVGGSATATRDPIAPWNVVVGRRKLGGTCVYVAEFGNNDKYLDLVLVLACHPCESVDELLFDGQRVQLDGNGAIGASTGGTSFTPVQQTINIFHISRLNNVVTVVLTTNNIPYLQDGDVLTIQGITGDLTLNGRFPVTIVSQTTASPGTLTFSYLCGGMATTVDNEGQVVTEWPDYGKVLSKQWY